MTKGFHPMKKLTEAPCYLLFCWVYHKNWYKAVVRPQRMNIPGLLSCKGLKSAFLKLCKSCLQGALPKPNPFFLPLCSWISGSTPLPLPCPWMWEFLLPVCRQWKPSWSPRGSNIPSWLKTCRWAMPLPLLSHIFWEHWFTIWPLSCFSTLCFSVGSSLYFGRLWVIPQRQSMDRCWWSLSSDSNKLHRALLPTHEEFHVEFWPQTFRNPNNKVIIIH